MTFSATSTTDEVLAGIDLSGQLAVVTGGAAGLGEETARALCSAGAKVVIVARNQAKIDATLARIHQALPEARIDAVVMDLMDLASVRTAAEHILKCYERIDMLINNAGVMACPLERSAEGCESQFATNHIGHFLFTCLLVPALKAAPAARVVTLSSGGHKYSPMRFDDPHFQRDDYHKWLAYGQSKTANALFSVALNKQLAGFGITANAVHPGAIITELSRYLESSDIEELMSDYGADAFVYKEVPQGAATSVWAATSPTLSGRGGLYLEDCGIGEVTESGATGYASYAMDEAAAEQLWALSEQIVGEQFRF